VEIYGGKTSPLLIPPRILSENSHSLGPNPAPSFFSAEVVSGLPPTSYRELGTGNWELGVGNILQGTGSLLDI